MKHITLIVLALLAGLIGGLLGSAYLSVLSGQHQMTDEDRIAEFYATETAVTVSPHHLRKAMDKGEQDFILVDVRSNEEYVENHIIGAVNIPAYENRFDSAYDQVDRIVSGFEELQAANPGKDIIVYCYSIPCMSGRKVGNILAQHDIYVKELGIGWNEWRYFWTLWNHEHEWNVTNPDDYVINGSEPGFPRVNLNATGCKVEGDFGC